MNHNTFDSFVRRTADLMDRRSPLGGLGGTRGRRALSFVVEVRATNRKQQQSPGGENP
jgi:hypothetical protein